MNEWVNACVHASEDSTQGEWFINLYNSSYKWIWHLWSLGAAAFICLLTSMREACNRNWKYAQWYRLLFVWNHWKEFPYLEFCFVFGVILSLFLPPVNFQVSIVLLLLSLIIVAMVTLSDVAASLLRLFKENIFSSWTWDTGVRLSSGSTSSPKYWHGNL